MKYEYDVDFMNRPFIKNSKVIEFPVIKVTMYVHQESLSLVVYQAKRAKPYYNVKHNMEVLFNKELAFYERMFAQQSESKIEFDKKSAELKKAAKEQLKIGSVLFSSWGHEQTNITFYQIVSIKGASYTFKEIASIDDYDNSTMSGTKMPDVGNFVDLREITARLGSDGSLKITSYESAAMWKGDKKYYSCYA